MILRFMLMVQVSVAVLCYKMSGDYDDDEKSNSFCTVVHIEVHSRHH
jgi:hypothetical protein